MLGSFVCVASCGLKEDDNGRFLDFCANGVKYMLMFSSIYGTGLIAIFQKAALICYVLNLEDLNEMFYVMLAY